jgi:hypothetical protein
MMLQLMNAITDKKDWHIKVCSKYVARDPTLKRTIAPSRSLTMKLQANGKRKLLNSFIAQPIKKNSRRGNHW